MKHNISLSKVPKAVYDSVLSLAEKQKEERANTWGQNASLILVKFQLKEPLQDTILTDTYQIITYTYQTCTYETPVHTSQGPSKLLGSLPYKGNEDDNHPHHNPLDAHKVDFLWKYFQMNIFSMEFDCTVRNITNLDFSIYVSFCVSWQKICPTACKSTV